MSLGNSFQNEQAASGRISILDFLMKELQCTYLSDLYFRMNDYQQQLIEALVNLPVDEHTLQDWNDALTYLVRLPAQDTGEEAKRLLLSSLSNQCHVNECP